VTTRDLDDTRVVCTVGVAEERTLPFELLLEKQPALRHLALELGSVQPRQHGVAEAVRSDRDQVGIEPAELLPGHESLRRALPTSANFRAHDPVQSGHDPPACLDRQALHPFDHTLDASRGRSTDFAAPGVHSCLWEGGQAGPRLQGPNPFLRVDEARADEEARRKTEPPEHRIDARGVVLESVVEGEDDLVALHRIVAKAQDGLGQSAHLEAPREVLELSSEERERIGGIPYIVEHQKSNAAPRQGSALGVAGQVGELPDGVLGASRHRSPAGTKPLTRPDCRLESSPPILSTPRRSPGEAGSVGIGQEVPVRIGLSWIPTLFVILILCVLPHGAVAQSPCAGRVVDKLNHPMDARLPKPAPGQSYVDPAFGTKITRITNADPAEGPRAVIKTLYSTMRGWNADGSLILLWKRSPERTYELYEGDAPYRHLRTLTFKGTWTYPADIEEVIWDPLDPLAFYYPSGFALSGQPDPRLYKRSLRLPAGPDILKLLRVFDGPPTSCTASQPVRLGRDPHDMALLGTGKIIGLVCGPTGTKEVRTHFLYSIEEDRVLAIDRSTSGTAPWVFPSGTGAYRPSGEITDLTLAVTRRLSMPDYSEHAALARAPAGDTYNHVQFSGTNTGTLVSHSLKVDGPGRVIIGPSNGWPYPPGGTHISTGAANGSGWVAVGISGASLGSQVGQSVLSNEVVLANVFTGEVCRVAHLRTLAREGPWGYWGESHVQISNDGYRVLFTSDWMGSTTVDTYVVDLRPFPSAGKPTTR